MRVRETQTGKLVVKATGCSVEVRETTDANGSVVVVIDIGTDMGHGSSNGTGWWIADEDGEAKTPREATARVRVVRGKRTP